MPKCGLSSRFPFYYLIISAFHSRLLLPFGAGMHFLLSLPFPLLTFLISEERKMENPTYENLSPSVIFSVHLLS